MCHSARISMTGVIISQDLSSSSSQETLQSHSILPLTSVRTQEAWYPGYKYTPATPGSDRTVNTIQVQTCLPLCSLGCRATRNMFQSRLLFHHCSLKEKHKGATQAAKQNCPTRPALELHTRLECFASARHTGGEQAQERDPRQQRATAVTAPPAFQH